MMEGDVRFVIIAFLVVFCATGSHGGNWCTKRTNLFGHSRTYCPRGCCGAWPSQYCCIHDVSVRVGWIAGGVIAGVAGLCVLVAVICVCVKASNASRGRVLPRQTLHTLHTPHVTVVSPGTVQYPMSAYGKAGPSLAPPPGQAPPPYSYAPPPAYAYADPAYPPPAPLQQAPLQTPYMPPQGPLQAPQQAPLHTPYMPPHQAAPMAPQTSSQAAVPPVLAVNPYAAAAAESSART